MTDNLERIGEGDTLIGPGDEGKYFQGDKDRMEDALVKLEIQRKNIRRLAVFIAIVVIGGAAYLEWTILFKLLYSGRGDIDSLVIWAIAPIASITLITVFLLTGAFGKSREANSASVASTLARIAGGSGGG